MTGFELLQAMLRGELPAPPIGRLIRMRPLELEPGRVVLGLEPEHDHGNGAGFVHGGILATLLDSAMFFAVLGELPAGRWPTTTQISVNYVRPVAVGMPELRALGQVVHAGRRLATAEGRATDGGGRVFATASTSCLIGEAG